MKKVLLIGLSFLTITSCAKENPYPKDNHFVEVRREIPEGWSGTGIYVVRHASGACFIWMDSRTLIQVDEKVCNYEMKVEK